MSDLSEDLRQLGEVLELDMPIISTKADKTVKAAADEIERLETENTVMRKSVSLCGHHCRLPEDLTDPAIDENHFINAKLHEEVERLKATNQRLNRRCQEVESAIKQNRYWSDGYRTGIKSESEVKDRRWQWIAQKHGEKNAKLKAEIVRLKAIVDACAVSDDAPCYYCGEPVEPLSGDPGRWPLYFSQSDEPGVCKAHHVQCILERLAIMEKLLEVADDLRCYTHDWDWKYGEYWDRELNEAREAVRKSPAQPSEGT